MQNHAINCILFGKGERKLENVMKIVLFAAAATLFVAGAPAFASIADEAEQGYAVYPPVSSCHFVKERVLLPNGHVAYQTHQVCN